MTLLITGCPRSGTKYISGLYQSLGMDLQHDRVGRDGIVSWCLGNGVPTGELPTWHGPIAELNPTTVIHLVRDPWACISSLTTIGAWNWIDRQLPIPDRVRVHRVDLCAWFWVEWNRAVRRAWPDSRIIHVEDLPSAPIPRNERSHRRVKPYHLSAYPLSDILETAQALGYETEQRQAA